MIRKAGAVSLAFALMAQAFQNEIGSPGRRLTAARPVLSARERECLDHAARGLSAKETSRLIERSVPTVVMHLNAAVRKLGARNRLHAVVMSLARGEIEGPET